VIQAELTVAAPEEPVEEVPSQQAAAAQLPLTPMPLAWAAAPVRKGVAPPPVPVGLTAVAVDEASGTVLYNQHAHRPLPPASLTKILTAILALENADIDAWVQSDVDSRKMVSSSVMGVRPGEWYKMRDLLYGLMLPSGNDAALVIARKVAGSDAAFVAMMNQFVADLGLKESQFRDPHGIGGRGHYASAYDMAMLARYAMQDPRFAEIARAKTWTTSGTRTFTMGNINAFLYGYPGADGIKTGFTWGAGPTLVASAVKNGHRVYVVVLNSSQKDADAKAILDWVFANYTWPSAD
jgi:serine-type D-Ala-D-Ala carboxypeptidase (penicillin-binding protein 5/6)